MILADTLKHLTTMTPTNLAQVFNSPSSTRQSFKRSKFVGITNGGEFCYQVEYHSKSDTCRAVDKVFVRYDPTDHSITAGY